MGNQLLLNRKQSPTPWQFFDRFFDEAFGRNGALDLPSLEVTGRDWVPSVDISERDGKLQVEAELPGLNKEDVDVDVSNGVLTISGKREHQHDESKGNIHRVERSYGSFRRSFTLPNEADTSKAEAEYKDGVLHVSIPLSNGQEATKISVK